MSLTISIPPGANTRLTFAFNPRPGNPLGLPTRIRIPMIPELRLIVSCEGLNFSCEKGNFIEWSAERNSNPEVIRQNTTTNPIEMVIDGQNKAYASGRLGWNISNGQLTFDEPNSKSMGFNTYIYPDDFTMMKCHVEFY